MSKTGKLIKNCDGETVRLHPEEESRRNLLWNARKFGFEAEARAILDRTDMLMARCTNPIERKHISECGCLELNNLLGGGPIELNFKKL